MDIKFQEWLKLNYDTKNTIRDYTNYMNNFFSICNTFDQETVNFYLNKKLEQNVKKSTFNKIVYALKTYAKFLKIDLEFPKSKIVDKKIKDYITLEDLEDKVLPMIDLIFNDHETYDLLIRFMFFTGLRVEETIKLEKSNIDFDKGIIRIIDTKGKVDREVPLLDEKLTKDLKKYSDRMAQEKLFNITYGQVLYNLKKLEKDIQWNKRIHPHFFRISFAKYCVSLNLNLSVIQSLLGHKDANTTIGYCEPDRKMVADACNLVMRKGLK